MNKSYLFINNPISGGGKHDFVEIFESFKEKFPTHKIINTTHIGHAKELASQYQHKYDIIVAVGGDGTINEIASVIINSNTELGIIPNGSANGLAFHLDLPMKVEKAILHLLDSTAKPIDVIEVNNRIFVNMAGVGFDGHINVLFNQTKLRGLWSYAKLIFTEYIRYKPFNYKIDIANATYKGSAFFIVFANTTQYGHNFHIAPNAEVNDGIMHITLVTKPPFIFIPFLLRTVFKGKALDSKHCTELACKEMKLMFNNEAMHLDGEIPTGNGTKELKFKVLKNALKVIY